MKRYEYKIIKSRNVQELKRLGGEGWLIVAVNFFKIYLARETKE